MKRVITPSTVLPLPPRHYFSFLLFLLLLGQNCGLGAIRFRFKPRVAVATGNSFTVLPFFIFLGRIVLFFGNFGDSRAYIRFTVFFLLVFILLHLVSFNRNYGRLIHLDYSLDRDCLIVWGLVLNRFCPFFTPFNFRSAFHYFSLDHSRLVIR